MPSIKSDFIKSKYIVEGLIKYCDKIKSLSMSLRN